MASADSYFLQPFKTHRKRLVPAQRVAAKSQKHALSEGERLGRSAEGVAVIHVTADDETGELSAIKPLSDGTTMTKQDILSKYAGAEVAVTLRQSIKRGGDLMAVYRMGYPSLEAALAEIGDDLLAGRVEKICADGHRLADEEIAAVKPVRNT